MPDKTEIKTVFVPVSVKSRIPELSGCYFVIVDSIHPMQREDFDNTTGKFQTNFTVTHWLEETDISQFRGKIVLPEEERIKEDGKECCPYSIKNAEYVKGFDDSWEGGAKMI